MNDFDREIKASVRLSIDMLWYELLRLPELLDVTIFPSDLTLSLSSRV